MSCKIQVSSKIIHARSGKDVASKFEELVSHFHKFGCPVMIGKKYKICAISLYSYY